jgi:aldehyde dehydrogenase (NAD+)
MTFQDLQTITLNNGKKVQVHTGLFINNEFVAGSSGKTITTVNPSTEEPIVDVQEASEADVDKAVAAAKECFYKVWRKMAAPERGQIIYKLADLIDQHAEELAELEAIDNGKAKQVAQDEDIAGSSGCYRYFAGWADKIHGKTIDTSYDKLCYTIHEPVGVVGAVIVSF